MGDIGKFYFETDYLSNTAWNNPNHYYGIGISTLTSTWFPFTASTSQKVNPGFYKIEVLIKSSNVEINGPLL